MNFQKYGGRRFILALGAGTVSTLLVWFGKIDGTVFATVVVATVAAYITGNVVESNKRKAPNDTSVDSE